MAGIISVLGCNPMCEEPRSLACLSRVGCQTKYIERPKKGLWGGLLFSDYTYVFVFSGTVCERLARREELPLMKAARALCRSLLGCL